MPPPQWVWGFTWRLAGCDPGPGGQSAVCIICAHIPESPSPSVTVLLFPEMWGDGG